MDDSERCSDAGDLILRVTLLEFRHQGKTEVGCVGIENRRGAEHFPHPKNCRTPGKDKGKHLKETSPLPNKVDPNQAKQWKPKPPAMLITRDCCL